MDGDDPIEMHAVKRFCHVTAEGNPDYFFEAAEAVSENEMAEGGQQEHPEMIQRMMRTNGNFQEDEIALARGFVDVDNDNDPAPENIPNTNDVTNPDMYNNNWGHEGICHRKELNMSNRNPKITFSYNIRPSRVQLFELLFPKEFIKNIILPQINDEINGIAVSYGEYLRWIGLWFLMATLEGPSRRDFWSVTEINQFEGAPIRLNQYMSRNRFEEILRSINYTDLEPPPFKDPFHPVRQMIEAWNNNMSKNFKSSWINTLDESMSFWSNRFTCPGYMFVPRKPWPFGNEYHSTCCGISGIMFAVELVEGRDSPKEIKPNFNEMGKTVGLLLRLTRSIWNEGKIVILDSGFCVLKGIIELRKKGVFGAALIKKRRYWPKFVKGDDNIKQFEDKEIGYSDSLPGKMDGVSFDIFAMKEPDYLMQIMSTYGTNERVGADKTQNYLYNGEERRKEFQYPEVVHNHFKYRHAVDDHNN